MSDLLKNKIHLTPEVPQAIKLAITDTFNHMREEENNELIRNKNMRGFLVIIIISILSIILIATYRKAETLDNKLLPTSSGSYENIKIEFIDPPKMIHVKKETQVLSASDQGITLSITEMAYDGGVLIFKYTIEANYISYEALYGAVFPAGISVGEADLKNITEIDSVGKKVNHTTYEGYTMLSFDWQEGEVSDPEGNITIDVQEVLGIQGDWEIPTHVGLNDIFNPPTIYEMNNTQMIEGMEIEVENLFISSFISQLKYIVRNSNLSADNHEEFRFFILNEAGRCMNYMGGYEVFPAKSEDSKEGEEDYRYDVYQTVQLMGLSSQPSKLTFIPYKDYAYKSKGTATASLLEKESKLHINDDFWIVIQNIHRENEEITFDYTFEGLFPEWSSSPFKFLDSQGRDVTIWENFSVNMDYELGVAHATYKVSQPEGITHIQVDKYFQCSPLKELAFDIILNE